MRWYILGLCETLNALHSKGFRMLMWFRECFAYNSQTDTVQLIQPGYGALFEGDKAMCDRGSFRGGTGPVFMSRLSTDHYVDGSSAGSAPRSVDRRNLAALQQDAHAEEDADEEVGDEVEIHSLTGSVDITVREEY